MKTEKFGDAVAALDALIADRPNHPNAHFLRSQAHFKLLGKLREL